MINKINKEKALFLSPHTDDVELGCGGTIARLLDEGTDIYVAVFSTAEASLPKDLPKDTLKIEFLAAMTSFGIPKSNLIIYDYPVRRLSYYRQDILENIVSLHQEIQPDIIFLPSIQDKHQDHQVLHGEGVRAFRDCSIFAYELPWNHTVFSTQAFVTLQYKHIEKKWEALQKYQSQMALNRRYFSREFIESLARVRGVQVNADWAESFEIVKLKW